VKAAGSSFHLPGAHEERFNYLSQPCKVLSSYHTPTSPDFNKTKPRDTKAIFNKNMMLLDYSLPSYLSGSSCKYLIKR